MILIIDNYDSFVHNLARTIEELGREPRVVRNDAVDVAGIRALAPRAIVLSPGPCDPSSAGVCLAALREVGAEVPFLGVCLGHQAIGAAFGGSVVRGEPTHGRASEVRHDGRTIFRAIPSPFLAARYHSLIVSSESLPESLEVSARIADGTIMGLRHRSRPIEGVQFHPESILTDHGDRLVESFLELAEAWWLGPRSGALPEAAGAPLGSPEGAPLGDPEGSTAPPPGGGSPHVAA